MRIYHKVSIWLLPPLLFVVIFVTALVSQQVAPTPTYAAGCSAEVTAQNGYYYYSSSDTIKRVNKATMDGARGSQSCNPALDDGRIYSKSGQYYTWSATSPAQCPQRISYSGTGTVATISTLTDLATRGCGEDWDSPSNITIKPSAQAPEDDETCTQEGRSIVCNEDADATTPTADTTTCAVDGIGWIVCPVVQFLGKLNDVAFGFLNGFLEVPTEVITDRAVANTWEIFRNMANIAFVIAFLFIIYSQITGAGIGNYGLKKLLPKLIIAAILVNVSIYICQILVDLSNIFGASIYDLFKSIRVTGGGNGEMLSTVWSTAGAVILGTGAVIGLLALIIFAPAALLAFAVIILILIARQAFVILLLILSPLAFVAYLLPNTEQWFNKWWKAFTALLMVFPIIALVFGASTFASSVLLEVSGDGAGGGDDEQMMKIVAAGVMAIPLFAVPTLLKGSMSAAGSIGGKLAGFQDRANGIGKNAVKNGRIGEAKGALDRRRAEARINRRVGEGRLGRLNKRIDSSRLGRYIGGDRGAAKAVAESHRFTGEQIENSMALLEHGDAAGLVERATAQLETANRSGDVIAARAATKILATKTGSKGVHELHEVISRIETSPEGMDTGVARNIKHDISGAGLKGKDRSLDQWSRDERSDEGIRTLDGYDSHAGTARGLNESELAGQSAQQLQQFADSGSMTQEQAQAVLRANENGTIYLDPQKKDIFTQRTGESRTVNVGEAHDQAAAENQTRGVNQAHEEALVQDHLFNLEHGDTSTPRQGPPTP
ncbi:MAG: type IV secretion system protein [Candidatus Saccharimonadales bacterium]